MFAIQAVPQRAKRVCYRHSVFVRPCGLPSQIFWTGSERNEISSLKIWSATKLASIAHPLYPLWHYFAAL